jgi:xylan 1,4-beta-xylosidase
MITTTFMPYLMASGEQYCFSTRSNVTPPKDYALWKDLVTKTTEHFIERFGRDTVQQWYFEVWNEPNLDAFWKGADKQEFFRLWKETYQAVKKVDNKIRIGGPSAARAEWIGEFIAWSRQEQCEPDYIITHVYNNDSASAPLSPFAGPQTDKINDSPNFLSGVVKGVRELVDSLGFKGEVHFNEWGRSWFPSDDVRETPNEAAFIVKSMAECSQYADYFAYWCISDIYDQLGYTQKAFAGTYGMLNINGLKKPSYKAHEMLCRLGDKRVPLKGEGADIMANAIATRSSNGFQFLFYAMEKDYKDGDTPKQKTIQVNLPSGVSAKQIKVYQLSGKENNVLHAWKEMGRPAYLKKEQVAELMQYNDLSATKVPVQIKNAGAEKVLTTQIEMPGLLLLEIGTK